MKQCNRNFWDVESGVLLAIPTVLSSIINYYLPIRVGNSLVIPSKEVMELGTSFFLVLRMDGKIMTWSCLCYIIPTNLYIIYT